jgi:hypothetical protein
MSIHPIRMKLCQVLCQVTQVPFQLHACVAKDCSHPHQPTGLFIPPQCCRIDGFCCLISLFSRTVAPRGSCIVPRFQGRWPINSSDSSSLPCTDTMQPATWSTALSIPVSRHCFLVQPQPGTANGDTLNNLSRAFVGQSILISTPKPSTTQ